MHELALFAGIGGGILGGHLLGWRTVCAVEIDPYCREVLLRRQRDGVLPLFPIWDAIETFDGKPWRGKVDIVTGGFPCQDISCAGKGSGITGPRSGLWSEMARIIGEVRPRFVFVENSPLLVRRGLTRVLADLAEMGYDAQWCCVSAADCGAPHIRDRIWILGYTDSKGKPVEPVDDEMAELQGDATNAERMQLWNESRRRGRQDREGPTESPDDGAAGHVADADGKGCNALQPEGSLVKETTFAGEPERARLWQSEPDVGRVAHGVAARVDRLKALGNGQVPAVAALAWEILNG
jgi:DNA (cytosine-5)-methyltransferase 1